jgi:hypothetical protein
MRSGSFPLQRIRPVLALVTLLAASGPVGAAENGAKPDGLVDVELPAIFAPMIVDARLESYAYLTIALTPARADKVLVIREKVPFLQDAFLRELNKGSIVKAGDPKSVDVEAVKARLIARVKQVLPEGTISDLKLEQIVVAPLEGGS